MVEAWSNVDPQKFQVEDFGMEKSVVYDQIKGWVTVGVLELFFPCQFE